MAISLDSGGCAEASYPEGSFLAGAHGKTIKAFIPFMARIANLSNKLWPSAGFFLALMVGAFFIWRMDFVSEIDHQILDAQFKWGRQLFPRPVRTDPVVVGINEEFLDHIEEPLALSHAYLARFLGAMAQAGPQAIGLDIVFPEKRFDTLVSTRDPQLDFHRTLLAGLMQGIQKNAIVAAKVWDKDRGHYRDIQVDYAAVLGMQGNVRQPLASAMFCLDADGRIRRYPGPECQPDRSESTFSSEIGAAMGVRQHWSGLINYQLGGAFTYIPIQDVLALAEQSNTARLRQLFEGRAVLLGTVLDDTDLVDLPVPLAEWRPGNRRVPGVLAHAQALRSMLNDGFIKPVPLPWLMPLSLLFGLFWLGRSVTAKSLWLLGSAGALLALCAVLLQQGWWLPPGAALMIGLATFGGRSLLEGWRNFNDKQRLTRVFSGYVSPVIMKEIVSGDLDANRQSRKAPVCVLFSDIRGFTTLCERESAEAIVHLLNRYFTRMVSVVHRHGGTVDKFMGDGLMAFFGAPNVLACPEKSALEAAHDMLRALDEFNRELETEGRAPLRIGIGLHGGDAVVGYVGSSERHEYTAIGDTVNAAARMEGLCKEVGYPIVCSDTVARAVDYPAILTDLGERPVKGHSPMRVYGWLPGAAASDASGDYGGAACAPC